MSSLRGWYLDYDPDLALSSLCSLFDVGCFDTTCAQGLTSLDVESKTNRVWEIICDRVIALHQGYLDYRANPEIGHERNEISY